jgi:hypothetical protein
MVHNGANTRHKSHLGTVKLGRYLCPSCRKTITEDGGFWDDLIGQILGVISEMCQILRHHHVSYEGIESIFNFFMWQILTYSVSGGGEDKKLVGHPSRCL